MKTLIFIASITLIIFLSIFYRYPKKFHKNNFKLNKKNLNTWMNFSKKVRYDISKNDSASYLDSRKKLLNQIRKEYKNLSDNNLEK
tara:strand:- start:1243 stop:1500 length:258 start_codon:yes stop_codon:yes gene_type:complete